MGLRRRFGADGTATRRRKEGFATGRQGDRGDAHVSDSLAGLYKGNIVTVPHYLVVKKYDSLLHLFSLVVTRYLYIYTKSVTLFPYEMKSCFIKYGITRLAVSQLLSLRSKPSRFFLRSSSLIS